jgi:hypothetical protein
LLLFDDPASAGSFSSSECARSSQDLTTASGMVTLECRLGAVWARIGGSDHIDVRFFINKVVRGSTSVAIAESDPVHYEVRRNDKGTQGAERPDHRLSPPAGHGLARD